MVEISEKPAAEKNAGSRPSIFEPLELEELARDLLGAIQLLSTLIGSGSEIEPESLIGIQKIIAPWQQAAAAAVDAYAELPATRQALI